jgi:alpha-L-fucosidase
MGQRIAAFTIKTFNADGSTFEIKKFTVGHKRIITFATQKVKSFRIYITESKAAPLLGEVDAFKIDDGLIEKE